MIVSLYLIIASILWLIFESTRNRLNIARANERYELVREFVNKYCDKELEEELSKYVSHYCFDKDVLDDINARLRHYMDTGGALYVYEKEHSPPGQGWWRFAEEGFPSKYMDFKMNKDTMTILLLQTNGKITEQYARGMTDYIALKSEGVTNEKIRQWIETPPWISKDYVKWSDRPYAKYTY